MKQAPGTVRVHRRAVVAGRAFDAQGRLFLDGASLSLAAVDPALPGASPAPWARRFDCHMRADGSFFFLDVPAGRYRLDRRDAGGEVVQSGDVTVPPVDPSEKVPVARIEFEIVGHVRPAPTERN